MPKRFWRRAARRLSLKLSFGLWLEKVLPVWTVASVLLSIAFLWFRGRGGEAPPSVWALVCLGTLVAAGVVQYFRERDAFYNRQDALVWLDHRLSLNNRLGSAEDGVVDWPSAPARLPPVLAWRLSRIVPPLAFSVALLALAALVPVPARLEPRVTGHGGPLSWQEMERAIDEMRQEEIVAEEALDAFEARLDSLRNRPSDEWFSHESLEASDTLKQELGSEMRALAEGLERVEGELQELAQLSESAPLEERRLENRTLRRAIDELDLGRALPLSQKLSRPLHVLARERNPRRLTDEEMERIRNAKERLYHTLPGSGDELVGLGLGPSDAASEPGRPGRGGITRGPGSAPIELASEGTELGTSAVEAVRNEDLSHASFGETLSIRVGDHDVDVSGFRSGRAAGAVTGVGEGGDIVWSQSLSPPERRVLRKYFK
ncbi:MAG TPA: hypothetical protein VLK65_29495 [Vicinamibacteria bacterium]|nr:hypothetical protein [Vicinamibacteria bacterium]